MSNSGARRQLVHADCVCLEPVQGLQQTYNNNNDNNYNYNDNDNDNNDNNDNDAAGEPILLTCFIALQDIDVTMGPTYFMPKTHTIDSHNRFFETGQYKRNNDNDNDDNDNDDNDDNDNDNDNNSSNSSSSTKNDILKSSKCYIGTLSKGSAIIFDPRVLHCAGENYSDPILNQTRALFYMTFKNSKIDNPGCPSTSGFENNNIELTMNDLVEELIYEKKNNNNNNNNSNNNNNNNNELARTSKNILASLSSSP
jgi:ectoine hydroxylase-related dioxygenase (phytanoyl-CoA dioxygenase family)